MIEFEAKLTGDLTGALDQFEKKVKEKCLRSGAYGMGKFIYEEAKKNVNDLGHGQYFYGKSYKINGTKYWFDSGALRNALYVARSPEKSNDNQAVYRVSWRTRPGVDSSGIKGVPYGHMVEYGTSRMAAHPFLGKARDQMNRAVDDGLKWMRITMSEVR